MIAVSIRVLARRAVRGGLASSSLVERAGDVLVHVVMGGAGGPRVTLTRHALAGGVVVGVVAIAQAFAGPGLSELLELVGAVSVVAIAVSAAICTARCYAAPGQPVYAGALIVATIVRVAPAHHHLLSARALELLCNPRPALAKARGLLREPRSLMTLGAGSILLKGGRIAFKSFVFRPALKLAPGLGTAVELVNVYNTSVGSMRFLRHFESAAAELCAAGAV